MTIWTNDRIARLKTLWLSGRSAARIARELGGDISRNAVLSKVRRLSLNRTAATTARRKNLSADRAAVTDAVGRQTILTVGGGDCRWPFGDPTDRTFRLCGRPVRRGAFCAAHADLAYRPASGSLEDLVAFVSLS